ncbi:hypothetical protein T265_02524 [Opisthorchis viverrini]|uniref:Uncharacterized protein n=1 Tax=Opisthorchis viverrini TaxID=6198 RepID=A0A075AI87_OPIVI|nr:hypothetical protein T265_02524 [Opisthorchis viverrini]KER31204.1 hypothetical protein T265_02524 [Opisthorchis viverrini]
MQLHEKDVLLPVIAETVHHSSCVSVASPFYLSVPQSCCYTLLDALTGYPTDTYRDQTRCQNWQYGPPLYTDGPHNDALYYRGCFPVLIDYMLLHTKHLFGLCIGLCVVLVSFDYHPTHSKPRTSGSNVYIIGDIKTDEASEKKEIRMTAFRRPKLQSAISFSWKHYTHTHRSFFF